MQPAIKAPVCKCGDTSVHKKFATFEYFYCPRCKTEVDEKKEWAPFDYSYADLPTGSSASFTAGAFQSALQTVFGHQLTPTGQQPQQLLPLLPPGIVALKGEDVTCEVCGIDYGTLIKDLPELSTRTHSQYVTSSVGFGKMSTCCWGDGISRYADKTNPASKLLYHIKNRGWM